MVQFPEPHKVEIRGGGLIRGVITGVTVSECYLGFLRLGFSPNALKCSMFPPDAGQLWCLLFSSGCAVSKIRILQALGVTPPTPKLPPPCFFWGILAVLETGPKQPIIPPFRKARERGKMIISKDFCSRKWKMKRPLNGWKNESFSKLSAIKIMRHKI